MIYRLRAVFAGETGATATGATGGPDRSGLRAGDEVGGCRRGVCGNGWPSARQRRGRLWVAPITLNASRAVASPWVSPTPLEEAGGTGGRQRNNARSRYDISTMCGIRRTIAATPRAIALTGSEQLLLG